MIYGQITYSPSNFKDTLNFYNILKSTTAFSREEEDRERSTLYFVGESSSNDEIFESTLSINVEARGYSFYLISIGVIRFISYQAGAIRLTVEGIIFSAARLVAQLITPIRRSISKSISRARYFVAISIDLNFTWGASKGLHSVTTKFLSCQVVVHEFTATEIVNPEKCYPRSKIYGRAMRLFRR